MGVLYLTPSAHLYSKQEPAVIFEHDSSVQKSLSMPCTRHTSLKRSTAFTASHSLMSSPSGSATACLRSPPPRVRSACWWRRNCLVPGRWPRRGLNVLALSPDHHAVKSIKACFFLETRRLATRRRLPDLGARLARGVASNPRTVTVFFFITAVPSIASSNRCGAQAVVPSDHLWLVRAAFWVVRSSTSQ